jgi:general secretion pathway protein G
MKTHSSKSTGSSSATQRSGFSLVELIVVMSIIALLVGVVTPAFGTMVRSKARTDTTNEMQLLSNAALDFYGDVGSHPTDVNQLLVATGAGWSGPYISGTTDDPWSGLSGHRIDGFGTAYRFTRSGVRLTITSGGPDRTLGNADDLVLVADATPLLRKRTLDRLAVVNTAITQYNSVHLATSPLSGNWTVAYSRLVTAGFLPIGGPERNDAWGTAFVGDPVGATPLVRVTSTNL